MTTIVNNPAPVAESDKGGSGFLIGIIVLIGFVAVLLYFGIPAIKRMGSGQSNTPQINIPNKIDVNVNQTP